MRCYFYETIKIALKKIVLDLTISIGDAFATYERKIHHRRFRDIGSEEGMSGLFSGRPLPSQFL